MFQHPSSMSARSSLRGTALVIILASLVLVSIIVLAFLSQALVDRQIASSSSGNFQAERVGQTALATIIGDLGDEIISGSEARTESGVTIYRPSTNFTAQPSRVGDQGFMNVVKKSVAQTPFWPVTNYYKNPGPTRAATGNSTTNLSLNGKFISPSRWNAPYLLGTNLPATFTPPDWIILTRSGAITNASQIPPVSQLANLATTNFQHAIGRYSYVIYDEGGLLDINVAGHPDSVNAAFKAKRGFLPQVALANVPGIDSDEKANALVRWRNAKSDDTYNDYVLHGTNNFLQVAEGDQQFVSRQDLIKYALSHSNQLKLEALPHLATSTREVNAPSYFPQPNRPRTKSEFPGAGKDDEINPILPDIRVTESFERRDGSDAKVGESLLASRFPLPLINLLQRAATAQKDDKDPIYRAFGIYRSARGQPWVYDHGAPDRILTLAEVAAEKREPDFFELLQAGITLGSLGGYGSTYKSDTTEYDKNTSAHVLQIGANIIDQYQEGFYPTRISLGTQTLAGIKNLPYLNRVFITLYRPLSDPKRDTLGGWYQPELWNPHFQGSTLPTLRLRFISEGRAGARIYIDGGTEVRSPERNLEAAGGIPFTLGLGVQFSRPGIPWPEIVDPGEVHSENKVEDPNARFLGIRFAYWSAPDKNFNEEATTTYDRVGDVLYGPVTHKLQYWDEFAEDWITYSSMRNVDETTSSAGIEDDYILNYLPRLHDAHIDPRIDRLGVFPGYVELPVGSNFRENITMREKLPYLELISSAAPGFVLTSPGGENALYQFSENKETSAVRYADPDGVVRPGAGAYATTLAGGGIPLGGAPPIASIALNRPIILNRAFRSVADLGYVSRDLPWKDLDFFTTQSGDSALLDIFTASADVSPIQAGRLNPNTRNETVLKTVLAGAIKSENDNVNITASEAENLAKSLVDLTKGTNGPLQNRSALVNQWAGKLNYSTLQDNNLKRRREAAIRALADISNTRTWNLLIDVVAQAGQYPLTAKTLNDFMVQGEVRYWVHLAIDRYTGQVIAQQVEVVSE